MAQHNIIRLANTVSAWEGKQSLEFALFKATTFSILFLYQYVLFSYFETLIKFVGISQNRVWFLN